MINNRLRKWNKHKCNNYYINIDFYKVEILFEGRILRRQAAAAAREAEEAQLKKSEEMNKSINTVKSEIIKQSSKPQSIKPAILGNASQLSSICKESSQSKSISTNLRKIPPAIIGNTIEASSHTSENDEKTTTSVIPEKRSIIDKQEVKRETDIINRIHANNTILTAPIQSSLPFIDPIKTTATKKAILKRSSTKTKTKTTDATAEIVPEKVESKKIMPKKISLEQAVPEIELNTKEVLKEVLFYCSSSFPPLSYRV